MWKRRKLLGRDYARGWRRRGGPRRGEEPRRRVLIEAPDAAEAFAYWRLLEDHGYEVSWCPGPDSLPSGRCPAVARRHCGLVQRADVVVSSLGLHRDASRDVVVALRRWHPEKPMIVQAPRRLLMQWGDLFEDGCGPVHMPVTDQTMLDAVALSLSEPVSAVND